MAAPKLPRPPQRGKPTSATGPETATSPAPSQVSPGMRAMTRDHARILNLDTGTHVDSKGVEHQTHDGNPVHAGPLTIVFATKMGHPPMRLGDHAKQRTNVHAHLRRVANAHPNELARTVERAMRLPKASKAPEGSPAEEAAETPTAERAEQRAAKRLPAPRKAA